MCCAVRDYSTACAPLVRMRYPHTLHLIMSPCMLTFLWLNAQHVWATPLSTRAATAAFYWIFLAPHTIFRDQIWCMKTSLVRHARFKLCINPTLFTCLSKLNGVLFSKMPVCSHSVV